MARLSRVLQKIFAGSAPSTEIGKFGSLAAGLPVTTNDPATIQALSNYLGGWYEAVVGNNAPAIEDRNAIDFLVTRQLAYLFESGVPEWDATTTYYIGNIVNSSGVLYVSLTDNNLNNAVSSTSNWQTLSRTTTGTFASPTSVGGSTAIPTSGGADNDIYVTGSTTAWVRRTPSAYLSWNSVCFSPELGLYVAVGDGTIVGTGCVSTSPDGITWTTRTAADDISWQSVCWAPQIGLFIAVSSTDGGTAVERVMTSPDGTTWTIRNASAGNAWNSVTWSPRLKLAVAVSLGGTNRVMTSPDGVTWTARAEAESNQWASVCDAPELGLLVAVAISGTHRVQVSQDGITWRTATAAAASNWVSVCWSSRQRRLVAVGGSSGTVMSSDDGITWTSRTAASADNWTGVIYIEEIGSYIACATASLVSTAFQVSSDGITWASYSSTGAQSFRGIAWAKTLNQICAVGVDAATDQFATFDLSVITAASRIAAGTVQGQRKTVIGASALAVPVLATGNGIQSVKTLYMVKNQRVSFMWDNARSLWLADVASGA